MSAIGNILAEPLVHLALLVLALAILLKFLIPKKPTYDWQPDLSHKIIRSETPYRYGHRNDTTTILVEKSNEERDEERHSYLKEK